MSSLAKCLDEITDLSKAEKDIIRKYAKNYHDEGLKGKEANLSAVDDFIKDLEKERKDIIKQVRQISPEIADSLIPSKDKIKPDQIREYPSQKPEEKAVEPTEVTTEAVKPDKKNILDKEISADRNNIRAWFVDPKDWDNKKRLTYREVAEQIKSDKDLKFKIAKVSIDSDRILGKTKDVYYIEYDGKKLREFPKEVYDYYQKIKPSPEEVKGKEKKEVSLDNIFPIHEAYDKEKINNLKKSMEENGWQGPPIVVWPYNKDWGYIAINGAHRYEVAKNLKIKIPIYETKANPPIENQKEHPTEWLKGYDDYDRWSWMQDKDPIAAKYLYEGLDDENWYENKWEVQSGKDILEEAILDQIPISEDIVNDYPDLKEKYTRNDDGTWTETKRSAEEEKAVSQGKEEPFAELKKRAEEQYAGWKGKPKKEDIVVKETKDETIIKTDLSKKEANKLSLKEQKAYLIAEIDKAIEIAPTGSISAKNQDMNKLEKFAEEKGLDLIEWLNKSEDITDAPTWVKIEIPGDGTFNIVNNKVHLLEFKKNAKQLSTSQKNRITDTTPAPTIESDVAKAITLYGSKEKAYEIIKRQIEEVEFDKLELARYNRLLAKLKPEKVVKGEREEREGENFNVSRKEFEDMIQRHFNTVRDFYKDDGIRTWKEYLDQIDANTVALEIESNYEIYNRYLRRLPKGTYAIDVVNAYKNNNLPDQIESKKKTPEIKIEEIQAEPLKILGEPTITEKISKNQIDILWNKANERITNNNKKEVLKARKDIFNQFALTDDFIERLELKRGDIVKKLRSWSNIPVSAIDLHQKVNRNLSTPVQWHGVINSAWISKQEVTTEDIDNLIKSVDATDKTWGTPDGQQLRNYISRTILGLDTRILFKDLTFKILSTLKPLGRYNNNEKLIEIRKNSPHTVSHEIGHYLDYKWADEAYGGRSPKAASTLLDSYIGKITPLRKQWISRFTDFVMDISERSDIGSEYYQDRGEVFARFFARFIDWVNDQAGMKTWGDQRYTADKFNTSDYYKFINLLQEKAYVDIKEPISISIDNKKYSLPKSELKPAKITREVIKEAFPLSRIKEQGEGFFVKLPNGSRIWIVANNGLIIPDPKAVKQEYGRKLRKDEKALATWQKLGPDGMMWLSGYTDSRGVDQIVRHEVFHAAEDMVLTESQLKGIRKDYKTSAEAADAYAEWDGKERNPIFTKIRRFFKRLVNTFFPNAFNPETKEVFEDIRSGKVFEQPVKETELMPEKYALADNFGSLGRLANNDRAKEIITRKFNDLMYWIVDKNRPIQTIQDKLKNVREEIDLFLRETQRPKITSAKIKEAWDEKVEPLIKEMGKRKINLPDFEEYVHAKHAPERNQAMRESNSKRYLEDMIKLLSADESNELSELIKEDLYPKEYYARLQDALKEYGHLNAIKDLKSRWEKFSERPSGMSDKESEKILDHYQGNQDMEDLRLMLANINAERLDILYNAGLLADEEYKQIKNKYKFYVPLYREGYETSYQGSGRGLQPAGRPIKTAMGSTRNVVNIMANSVSNLENAISRAEKAESAKTLYELIENNPNSDIWTIGKVKKSPTHDSAGNIKMYPDLYNVAPNEMRIMVNGEQYLVTVNVNDKDAMLMLKTLKAEDNMSGPMLNALSKVNKWFARINTSWSPEFMLTNPIRDITAAGININDTGVESKRIIRGALAAIKAIAAVERGKPNGTDLEKLYDRFKKAGAKIGWSDLHGSVDNLTKKITKEIEMQSGQRPVRKTITEMLDFIENWNTSIENGIRLHVFKMAVEQGMTDRKAAQIASDITVDFTKKGAAGPVINSLYLFANAGIQGSYRIIRAGAKSPKVRKIMAGIVGAGLLNGLLNAAIGGEDDDGEDFYNKIDDYVQERNMIFMLPGTKGKYAKIPLPWGYNLFWNMGTELSKIFTKENYRPMDGAGRLSRVFIEAFNPIQSGTLLQTLAPTIVDPFAMVAENKNWFGGNLMPEKNIFEKVPTPDSQRYWKTVRTPSKWIAETLNDWTGGSEVRKGFIDVSPETLDLIVDTLGGSALRFFVDTMGTPFNLMNKEKRNFFTVPFLRRVAGQKSEWADQRVYYDNLTQVLTAKEELATYKGTKYYNDLNQSLKGISQMIPYADQSEKIIRKLKRARNKTVDQKQKTKFDDMINQRYIQFNKKFYEVMK